MITKYPYEERYPLITAELLSKIRALPQIAGIIYCVREGAVETHNEMKTLSTLIVHVVKDLTSNSKQKDKFETNG